MDPAPAERSEHLRGTASIPTTIAIVVSHNSAVHLQPCLSSLEAQQGVAVEIHVVDNASTDGSAELVRREFPGARLIVNAANRGFARANNQVLDHEAAEFYALVNPDTVLPPDAVSTCVNYLRGHSQAGIAGTRLVFPDGTLQPSCYSFLDLRNLFGETFGVHRLLPWIRPLSSFRMPWFRHDRILEVDWLPGAFLVVRGEVVRAVGGLDGDFFMYGEEMDWCRRIRDAGWKVVFLPEPPVVHVVGGSSKPVAGPMFVENLKARVRYLRKHRGVLVATVARCLIAVSVLLRFAWRELRSTGRALGRRAPDEDQRRSRAMFRAAARWVLRGLPG